MDAITIMFFILGAALGGWIGTTKWFDKMMTAIGDAFCGKIE